MEALDDQALRVRILEKEPKNLNDALNLASRLEAFDIMGFTGPEAEKSKLKMRTRRGRRQEIHRALMKRRCVKKS